MLYSIKVTTAETNIEKCGADEIATISDNIKVKAFRNIKSSVVTNNVLQYMNMINTETAQG